MLDSINYNELLLKGDCEFSIHHDEQEVKTVAFQDLLQFPGIKLARFQSRVHNLGKIAISDFERATNAAWGYTLAALSQYTHSRCPSFNLL